MKKINYLVPVLFVAFLSFSGCVSKKKYRASEERANRLQSENDELQMQIVNSRKSIDSLISNTEYLQSAKSSVEQDLRALSESSKMTIADQARRLKNLQDLLQSQRDAMNRLKKTVSDALVKYKSDDLSVYIKNGNVYVSLQEKLLFKSGSAVVDPKGKEALKSLAEVLRNTPNISVMIEGHTDTVPIKTDKFPDNWALSVARATSIVRILTTDYGVSPSVVTASGKSSFYPVANNTTSEGRASNRRTEIILSPDLKELYELLGQ